MCISISLGYLRQLAFSVFSGTAPNDSSTPGGDDNMCDENAPVLLETYTYDFTYSDKDSQLQLSTTTTIASKGMSHGYIYAIKNSR